MAVYSARGLACNILVASGPLAHTMAANWNAGNAHKQAHKGFAHVQATKSPHQVQVTKSPHQAQVTKWPHLCLALFAAAESATAFSSSCVANDAPRSKCTAC